MAVTITGNPTAKPTNIAWSRSGATFTVTWEATEQDATDEDNSRRVENTWIYVVMATSGMGNQYIYKRLDGIGGEYTFTLSDTLKTQVTKFTTSSYILFRNTYGNGTPVYLQEVKFTNPTAPAPTIDYDYTTGAVTLKIEGNEAVFSAPRRTYTMKATKSARINGSTTSTTTVLPTTECLGWDSNTEQYTYSKEVTEETKLQQQNDYILYELEAQALGTTLRSAQKFAYLRICYPEAPVIQGFYKTTSGANVLVAPKTTVTGVDRANVTYQLQVQYGSTIEAGWTNIGEEFESTIVSLPLEDADIQPEAGQHVYIRVVATYFGRSTPSSYWQVDDKYYYHADPSYSTTDDVRVEKAEPNDDTTSISLVLSYTQNDNYNATLLAYSTDAYAWKSTKEPETFEMPDSKWQDAKSQSSITDYKSSSITLADLEEDTTYYLRARRYSTADTGITSLYSKMVSCNTSQTGLGAVVLSAPATVLIKKKAKFTWTMPTLPDGYVVKQWILKNNNGVGIVNGTTGTSCEYLFQNKGEQHFYLNVSVYHKDSGSVTSILTSNSVTVEVVNDPTLIFAISPPTTLTTLPFLFKIGSGNASAKIQVNILNETGTKRVMPNGAEEQCAGDIVYSQTGYGSVTCSINDGTNFWNNGQYIIQAVATVEGIQSNTLTRRFNVNYSTKLSAPTRDNVKITPAGKAVNIAVKNLDSDITCEIYRATVDGKSALITDGLTINASQNCACDRFAPYALDGTCKYIILVKNAQNQYAYGEYEYTLKAGVLRFDWDSNSIELPYNIEISDEIDKQFEQQVYLDGTQRGSWGASVTRTATLSTDTVYIKDKAVQEKVRKLARYQGAVFVRTPLGQAYCANVDVKDISKAYNSNVMAVEFECTEIDLTSEFSAQSEIIVSSEVVA